MDYSYLNASIGSHAQAVVTNPFLVIRTSGDPALVQGAIRAAVHEMEKSVPVYQVSTLQDFIFKAAAQPRFQTFFADLLCRDRADPCGHRAVWPALDTGMNFVGTRRAWLRG